MTADSIMFSPEIDSAIHWLFGPGWYIWLIAAAAVLAVYALRIFENAKQVTKEAISPSSTVPSAADYLKKTVPETQVYEEKSEIEEDKRREEEWRKKYGPPPDLNHQPDDPRLVKLNEALNKAEDKMLNSVVDAIDRMKFKVNLQQDEVTITASAQPEEVPAPLTEE